MNEMLRNLLFLPEQRSTVAQEIDTLHYVVILTSTAGAVLVSVVTLYFLVRYHRRASAIRVEAADSRSRRGHGMPVWIEFIVAGALLGMFLVWWVIGFRQYVHLRSAPAADVDTLDIYVTGKQWMWNFAYPDGSVSTSNLYVPEDRPIKLIMTSRDVIHSFYVPQFRIKQDVVPGFTTTMWFEATEPGRYDIFCTEYCGTHHSTMRGQVVVLPASEYARLPGGLEEDELRYFEPTAVSGVAEGTSLARQGELVAARVGCLRCHTVDGTPDLGPTWAGLFGSTVPLADGSSVIADEAYLTDSMMRPLAQLHRGFPPVMPSYLGTLSAAETGALVAFIRSLRDGPADLQTSMPVLESGDSSTPSAPARETTPPAEESAPPAEESTPPAEDAQPQPATEESP